LVVAAVVGGALKVVSKLRGANHHKAVASANPKSNAPPSQPLAGGRPDGSAEPAQPTRRRPRKPTKVAEAPKDGAEASGSGSVQVVVKGPANATVLVDGQQLENWFGGSHDLSAGEHTFEFRPPNNGCCEEAPVIKTVSVRPGETLTVSGTIAFKPATLEFKGPPLSTALCGEVATFNGPGQKVINMQKASLHTVCNVIPAPGSGEAPKAFDVDLIPGRTSTFPRTQ
jgi:hypothetical protein